MKIKRISVCAMLVALSIVLSMIKFSKLPFGGSITCFSTLTLALCGYFFDFKTSILSCFVFSLLNLVVSTPYMIHPAQFLFDYILSYTSFFITCFYNKNIRTFTIGFIIASLLRYFFFSLSGYFFWNDYCPENQSLIYYTLTYNASYTIPEMGLGVVLLYIPSFARFVDKLKATYQDK